MVGRVRPGQTAGDVLAPRPPSGAAAAALRPGPPAPRPANRRWGRVTRWGGRGRGGAHPAGEMAWTRRRTGPAHIPWGGHTGLVQGGLGPKDGRRHP